MYIYKVMNYKDKKYLSEDRWLIQNLNKLNFFVIAQLKSCNSNEWIELQKNLAKLDLKIKLISFKNLKTATFFGNLSDQIINSFFRGKIVLIYSSVDRKVSKTIIENIKKVSILEPSILYYCGRFLNINSKNCYEQINDFHFSEWTNVFNQLSGLNTYSVLNNFKSSSVEVLQSQHIELLQILMNKREYESKL